MVCDNPGTSCTKSRLFSCKQDKTRMEVVFLESRSESDDDLQVRTVRNITVNVGCSCVTSKIRLFKHISRGPEE